MLSPWSAHGAIENWDPALHTDVLTRVIYLLHEVSMNVEFDTLHHFYHLAFGSVGIYTNIQNNDGRW